MKRRILFKSLLLIVVAQSFLITISAQENEQKAKLVVETGHNSAISSVAFSPDGKTLASASADHTIKLWNAATGQELVTLNGHTDSVHSVAFSPDGKFLASGSSDKTVRLWNAATGQPLKTFKGFDDDVRSVIFSHNGKILVGASYNQVKFWNVETGQEIKNINTQGYSVNSAALSSDDKILASANGNSEYSITLWSVETGQKIKTLIGHKHWVMSVAFSPDGETLASASVDETVKLWDVETGKEIKTFLGHSGYVSIVTFSPDGKYLASAGNDGLIRLWNVETRTEAETFVGHNLSIPTIAFSPDGKTLASGSQDETIKLWDVETKQSINTLRGHSGEVSAATISSDGKYLASIGTDNWDVIFNSSKIRLWNLESGQGFRTLNGHKDSVNAIKFSRDGKILVSGSRDKTVKLWDAETGREIKTLNCQLGFSKTTDFSPDGKVLAAACADDAIKLWTLETGEELKTLTGHGGSINRIRFSPDGKYLASGNYDNTVKLWRVETGQELKTFRGHSGEILSVAFSPNAETLASGSADKTVKLWSVETGQLLKTLTGHNDSIVQAEFSSDGKSLVSFGQKSTKLWNTETGQEVKYEKLPYWAKLAAYKNSIGTVNGKTIYVQPDQERIRIFDISDEKNTKELCSLIALEQTNFGEYGWVAATPDGRFDTDKSLDNIEGLHWIVNDEIYKPLPLDIFMRQYYEPNLLRRVLAGEDFKPLPPIADINRVQPTVKIKEIDKADAVGTSANVVVQVENVTEDVSASATDQLKKKRLSSGAYDLRLFRDGQLVGVSTPKEALANYYSVAPTLSAPEEKTKWRDANDIFKLKPEDIKIIAPDKVEFTFRNIKISYDKRKFEFTAYAFNSDKVKSETARIDFDRDDFRKTNNLPVIVRPMSPVNSTSFAPPPLPIRSGRAYLISIGVNASENPAYDLRYAANDARKMQEILGERLKADITKYLEVVQVPLISDYGADKKVTENTARKEIIKGVFSLLAGNGKEVPKKILKQIPNYGRIRAVEPDDTLIITFSGHGYTDQSGIFYIVPYDIGKDTTKLTPEVLQKTISSDEISLWMQDITASEMIFIIDACHSSAAVEGDGFKPGPMGSRGLGQLAYDKDMKILAATQANNIALESNNLEQGLLSYALLQDGIKNEYADADKDKYLLSTEWLSFAERRVPELYGEIKDGKRDIIVDGKNAGAAGRAEIVEQSGEQKNVLNLQQPSLFDFKRRGAGNILFNLP